MFIFVELMSSSHEIYLMAFHWCLTDSKNIQVTKALLIILDDFKSALFWFFF